MNLLLMFSIIIGHLWGCSGGPKKQFKTVAEDLYWQGMEALEDQDYQTANERFRRIKIKYLFSPFAALAELRLGDSALQQGNHYEAIETYRAFIRDRPQHEEIPHAYWQIGVSYHELRPSTIFILPPAYERDTNATKNAVVALQNYLKLHPKHKHAPQAQKMVLNCRQELASHELYVARFYRDQEKWKSARGRYETLLSKFEDTPELWLEGALELLPVYQALKLKSEKSTLEERIKKLRARQTQAKSGAD